MGHTLNIIIIFHLNFTTYYKIHRYYLVNAIKNLLLRKRKQNFQTESKFNINMYINKT